MTNSMKSKETPTMRTHASIRGIIAAIALVSLTAACASCGKAPESGGTPQANETTIMTPEANGEVEKVRWNLFAGEPDSINPFRSADYSPNTVVSNMCETLLAQKPDYTIEPNLATQITNPDPLHWVIDLRDDVTFWDGSPMTAADVVFSMNVNLTDPRSFYNYIYERVASVDVTGDHQVTVTLSQPDFLFPEELASFAGVVVQQKYYEANAENFGTSNGGLMCTGPFQLAEWNIGQSITLEKNGSYWNQDLQPKIGTLEFTFLINPASITSALISGEIDGQYNVSTSSLAQLRQSSTGSVYLGTPILSSTFVYANPEGAMSDARLREALQIAIDWDGIAKSVFNGAGEVMHGPAPVTTMNGDMHDQLIAGYEALPAPQSMQYDKAKELLKDVPADVLAKPVSMVVPASGEGQGFGLAVESAAKEIGLDFTLKVVPPDVFGSYLYDPQTRGDTDMLYTRFWPNIPNTLDWFWMTAVSGGSFNQYGYTGVDELFAQAIATEDPAARADLTVEMQAKLREDLLPMVPGIATYNSLWLNKRISGAPASFNFAYYPWAAYIGGTE